MTHNSSNNRSGNDWRDADRRKSDKPYTGEDRRKSERRTRDDRRGSEELIGGEE